MKCFPSLCGIILATILLPSSTTAQQTVPASNLKPSENSKSEPSLAITEVLAIQTRAWNSADIPRFMSHYWKSDKLTFSSGGTTRRGWQATLESYQKKYPTSEKMGKLRFTELEIDELSSDIALVLGKWHLQRTEDADIGGNFSLIFRKIENQWLIIHDHSSSLEE